MENEKRLNKTMRVGDVIPMTNAGELMRTMKDTTDKIQRHRAAAAELKAAGENFRAAWFATESSAEKYVALKRQLAPVTKTIDVVQIPGQIKISEDPKAFSHMVTAFCAKYELPAHIAAELIDDFIAEYPDHTMQHFGLYFKLISNGSIQIFGKMNYHAIRSNINHFDRWIVYHHDIHVRNAEHMIHKEGSRDFHEWYNNGRPEGEEL